MVGHRRKARPRHVSFAPGPIDRVAVVVPARDEAATIVACLGSIDAAARHVGVPVDVVVAADRCRDDTVAQARSERFPDARVTVIPGRWGSASAARRAGTAAVLAGVPIEEHPRWWLAHTDADSVVPVDWLERHLGLADRGALAVAGIVRLDPDTTPPALLRSFQTAYGVAGPTHTHLHAANLGVRADAYVAAGGWRADTLVGEDHHLGADLAAIGVPVVRSSEVVVVTSARTVGRLPGGFASNLARLERTA